MPAHAPARPGLLLLAIYSTVIGMVTEVEVLRALGEEPTARSLVRRRADVLRSCAPLSWSSPPAERSVGGREPIRWLRDLLPGRRLGRVTLVGGRWLWRTRLPGAWRSTCPQSWRPLSDLVRGDASRTWLAIALNWWCRTC